MVGKRGVEFMDKKSISGNEAEKTVAKKAVQKTGAKSLPQNFQLGLGRAKKFGDDFKAFAMKGNVIDLAVGIIIGAAFGRIVTSLVNDMLMPLIIFITGQNTISALSVVLRAAVGGGEALLWRYGNFIQTVIDFLIIAFFIFMFVKFLGKLKRKAEIAPEVKPEPSAQEVLLAEILDELKKK